MEDKKFRKFCGTCCHFYDVWADGTGKCDKAHGAIAFIDWYCKYWEEG